MAFVKECFICFNSHQILAMYLLVLSLIIMANEVLAEIDRQNIIFDVVDGIPPSGDESDEIISFRSQIEADNLMLEYSAEELGFNNVLFEYLSQG
ncbi:hypothetical protein [Prochlorococcus marinus]|uniref:hypothetical protein n=1 Tax=Prochlorococcus marinus TaxID=1219 RepID=UPI0022B48627|nr:hypothetical protein [Prochlorococcus marinus]